MNLAQRSILLTGASGGIGAATAALLAGAGARVLVTAQSSARLELLVRSLASHARDGQVVALAADLTQANDRTRLRDVAIARRVDLLVNNAGTPAFGPFDECDDARIAQVIAVNLTAPVQLVRALLPHLRALPAATIVNVGSTLGSLGVPGFAVYAASKAGLHLFSQSLRRELSATSVNVQYFAPRTTRTRFNSDRAAAFNRATGAHEDEPGAVAQALLQFIERGTPERHLGFPEALAARVNGLVPRWLDPVFRRHGAILADLPPPATEAPAPSKAHP